MPELSDDHLAGYYLGFDFGLKRIGVASGQLTTCTATALTILSAQDGIPDWEQIDTIIHEWKPIALIVGMPLTMHDTEQHLTHCTRRFAKRLIARYQLPVHFVDERLSSRAAKEQLYEAGGRRAVKGRAVDHVAAQLILEQWLRQKK